MLLVLLTQEGCCLAFSVGFPLLGKRHRKHVHRCFSVAAQILQDLESPLARLRAQLHLEARPNVVQADDHHLEDVHAWSSWLPKYYVLERWLTHQAPGAKLFHGWPYAPDRPLVDIAAGNGRCRYTERANKKITNTLMVLLMIPPIRWRGARWTPTSWSKPRRTLTRHCDRITVVSCIRTTRIISFISYHLDVDLSEAK